MRNHRLAGGANAVHLLLLLLLFLAPALPAAVVRVANPGALPVIDNAGVLSADEESSISARLRALADTDGSQVAVLTVPTTGDEDIFTFAQRTYTEWGIGQKKENNGALFVVAVADRQMRIHTGYGLEGSLPDAVCKRIISTVVAPEFKQGRYAAGIGRGVDTIIAAVRGEYKAPERERSSGNALLTLIIIVLVLYFMWSLFRANGGGGGGGTGRRRSRRGYMVLPNVWTTGGSGGGGGWGHSGGDFGGGGFGGGFGGGMSGGGGASGGW